MKGKLIAGLILGGAAILVASFVKNKKKYAEVQTPEEEKKEESEETKVKIAQAAEKVVNWVLTHEKYFKAIKMVGTLAYTGFELRNAVNAGRKDVSKTPTKKGTLDIVIEDMLKKNYNAASIDWNGIATVDVNLREVRA